jgi:hypothetical protein
MIRFVLVVGFAVLSLTVSTESASAATCAVPAAIPNDGQDDRAAIQAALDTQGCVELEAGVYDIAMPIPRPPGRAGLGMLQFTTGDVLRGKGPLTRLQFTGGTNSGDWYGLWVVPETNDVVIEDLYLDSTLLTHNNEQTHAIQLSGLAERITISQVWFDHPERAGRGGDCIKIVGSNEAPVSAKIESSWFVRCDRSGVASTGGGRSLLINGNTFFDVGNQDIDIEASKPSSSVTISNNHMFVGPSPNGSYSVGITTATRVVFSNNHLFGRGVMFFNVDTASISDSTIFRTVSERGEPVIELMKAAKNITINNVLAVRAITTPGAVIRAGHHSSAYPSGIQIMNSSLRSASDAALIAVGTATDLTVSGNRLERTVGTTWAGSRAIEVVGTLAKTEQTLISGNMIIGQFDSAIRLKGTGEGIGNVTMGNNSAPGAVTGLICTSSSGITGRLVSSGNNWPSTTCENLTISPGN